MMPNSILVPVLSLSFRVALKRCVWVWGEAKGQKGKEEEKGQVASMQWSCWAKCSEAKASLSRLSPTLLNLPNCLCAALLPAKWNDSPCRTTQTIPKHMEWWAKQCWHPWWVWWGWSCMASIVGELLCTWATRDYHSRLLSAISLFSSVERLHYFGGCPNHRTLFAHWVESEDMSDIRMIIHWNWILYQFCFQNTASSIWYARKFVYFAGRWAIPWCQGTQDECGKSYHMLNSFFRVHDPS